jgi:hypothetical protein
MDETKKVLEGVVQPFHEGRGWWLQGPIDARANDPGVRPIQSVLQWAIGKKVRITVEEIEIEVAR